MYGLDKTKLFSFARDGASLPVSSPPPPASPHHPVPAAALTARPPAYSRQNPMFTSMASESL